MSDSKATADRYFAGMRARDVELVLSLFAETATVNLPDGSELAGTATIRQWFSALLGGAAPSPSPSAYVVDARSVAVEIQTTLPDGSVRRTANFFRLNELGLIEGLTSYARANPAK